MSVRNEVSDDQASGNSPGRLISTDPFDQIEVYKAKCLAEVLQKDTKWLIRNEEQLQKTRQISGKQQCQDETRWQKENPNRFKGVQLANIRQQYWSFQQVEEYNGIAIHSLPKDPEYWKAIDLTKWTQQQLDAACCALDLGGGGKKLAILARLQNWVNRSQTQDLEEQQQLKAKQDDIALASGRVFAFGRNTNGELGLGHCEPCKAPVEITWFIGKQIEKVIACSSATSAIAISRQGNIYAWGVNKLAQLSNTRDDSDHHGVASAKVENVVAKTAQHLSQFPISNHFIPKILVNTSTNGVAHGISVVSAAIGRSGVNMAFVATNGNCYTWGFNEFGILGREVQTSEERNIGLVESLKSAHIVQVCIGNCHTAAISRTGNLYTWGACANGQLGLGVVRRAGPTIKNEQLYYPIPTLVQCFPKNVRVIKVSCGAVHTGVISDEGELFTFGCGDGGRLGLGDNASSTFPQVVRTFSPGAPNICAQAKHYVVDICCSTWHSLCLVSETGGASIRAGYVYAFGSGMHGQLGLGHQKISLHPLRVPYLYEKGVLCAQLACSAYHSCAVSTHGQLFSWGQNVSGCLGHSIDKVNCPEPELVNLNESTPKLYGVGKTISVAAGLHFTVIATEKCEQNDSRVHYCSIQQLNACKDTN